MSQKTEDEEKLAQEKDERRSSGWGGILVLLAGLAAIAGIFAFARMSLPEGGASGYEAPLCTIMLEVNALDQKTRQEIESLERDVVATGVLDELGPGSPNVKYLLPAGVDSFSAARLGEVTDAEWPVAWGYMKLGDWFVPRFFRLDGTACVIRVGPKPVNNLTRFTPETAEKLKDVIEKHREKFKAVHAYSHLGGIGEAADRDAINVSFGVQTQWVKLSRNMAPQDKSDASLLGMMRAFERGIKGPLLQKPSIRSVVSPVSWATYAQGVMTLAQKEPEVPRDEATLASIFKRAHELGINPLLSPDNTQALVEVGTTAEGKENTELPYYMAVTLQETVKNVRVSGERLRPVKYKPDER
ncbi:hypothetical protein HY251_03950 [bacterium]|nr:hypothetical protein [bacterium]